VNASVQGRTIDLYVHPTLSTGNFQLHRKGSRSFEEFLTAYLAGDRRSVAMDVGEARFQGNFGERVKRYFFSHASFGLPAAVLHRLPNPSTRAIAFRTLIRVVPFYRTSAFRMEVNGKTLPPDFLLGGFIQNIPWSARGIRVASSAKDNDSLLDFITLRSASWPMTIWAAARLIFKDELTGQFLNRESIRHLKIESTTSQRSVRIEIDGESWGHLPVEIENRAARFKFLE
jgi:diacylglycerol kinase family enzyme